MMLGHSDLEATTVHLHLVAAVICRLLPTQFLPDQHFQFHACAAITEAIA